MSSFFPEAGWMHNGEVYGKHVQTKNKKVEAPTPKKRKKSSVLPIINDYRRTNALEKNKILHSTMTERIGFYRELHSHLKSISGRKSSHLEGSKLGYLKRSLGPIGVYPLIAYKPIDLWELYQLVEKEGGHEKISYDENGNSIAWSEGWERVYKALLPSPKLQGPQFDPNTEKDINESLEYGDVRWRRLKLRYIYDELLSQFKQANVTEFNNDENSLGNFVRCVCGHTHLVDVSCKLCETYMQLIDLKLSIDHIQCEACGSWQHLQCLLEEKVISIQDAGLFEGPEFHYYCEMCTKKKLPTNWSNTGLSVELPLGWTCERRMRGDSHRVVADYYYFAPGTQILGRFTRDALRSIPDVKEVLTELENKHNIKSL